MSVVQYSVEDGVACVAIDDGKANALSIDVFAALNAALDRAKLDAKAVLITGREGKFSAGFDLGEMMKGPESARALVAKGAEFFFRLSLFEKPVVASCTGHALAAGGILLMCCDYRVGNSGRFKLGFNEVAIGLVPPIFLVELARMRLSKRWFSRAVTQAEIVSPSVALDMGLLDEVVDDDVYRAAFVHAARLGQLSGAAFARAKLHERKKTIDELRSSLDDDLASFTLPAPA